MNIKHTILLSALLLASPNAFAKSWVEVAPAQARTEASLTKGSPIIMRTDSAFSDIMVADASIADVVVLTDRSFHLMGKSSGKTNIMLYDKQKRLIDIVDVSVGYDVAALKKSLHETFPSERIEVRPMAGGVYLSGKVSTGPISERAFAIAERYAPNDVTNGMVVKDSHQVMLEVRFVEASREAIKDLGIGLLVQNQDGNLQTGSTTNGLGRAIFNAVSGTTTLDMAIDALEEQGVIRTLAEPNLVAMSGETASFLAGGEFPVPVQADLGKVTVEFRQFGVGLAFTPTVLDDGIINLKVAPEVSQIDPTRSVRVGGIDVPAISVRRASTTVELRNDQSFAIAGLLQNTSSDTKTQVPWLGDIPILGSLFRSTRYRKSETELVILITPHLVAPVSDISDLKTPLDDASRPSEAEQFLLGRLEGPKVEGGGLSANYGHVLQ
jgi:pilus assembly protein CpaC